MRVRNLTFVALMVAASAVMAQEGNGYQFTDIVSNKATSVKNQAATGTCWCFATTSFMESELLRMGKGEYDLSEMFIVRQKYMNQLADNYLRRGRGNIGQGSISPSWMTAFQQVGIVPEEVYSGINYDSKTHNHTELEAYMSAIAGQAVKKKHRSPEYNELMNTLFDIYMGKLPETFTYNGKEYTPKSFAESLGLNMDDYVMLTSFTHKPYYEKFELEIPEVANGDIVIKNISRDPGNRTKVSVYASKQNIDPIGTCVGFHGQRIDTIVSELNGEKIDLIEYTEDPLEYIARALSPAQVLSVETNESLKASRVIVPDDKLSLAIGKNGQNVRLAARLTGWKIEVKPESSVTQNVTTKEPEYELTELSDDSFEGLGDLEELEDLTPIDDEE